MAEVMDGMDVARVREVARALTASGDRVDSVRERGEQQATVLGEVWSGEDLEEFTERWQDALPELQRAGHALLDLARELLAQAGQQEDASGDDGAGSPFAPGGPFKPFGPPAPAGPPSPFAPGGPFNPLAPADPFNPFHGADGDRADHDDDRGWRPPGWDTFKGVDDWRQEHLKVPLLLNDGREMLGDFFKDAEGKPRTFVKPVPFLSKVLPFVGVVDAERESMDVRKDLMRGTLNPAEVWDKMFLGRGSAAAAFIPGPGTLISAGLALEQFRAETKDEFDEGVAEKTGLNENVVTALRLATSPPISLITEVLPDKDFHLPKPRLPDIDLPDRPTFLGG